jgi:cyclophilin family peptidyl-prolyl cis-trans isomerase
MCKESGFANTNECQFYITTAAPLSYMDGKNVVFGRVVNGMRTIKVIEKIECFNQVPNSNIKIVNAGVYDLGHLAPKKPIVVEDTKAAEPGK